MASGSGLYANNRKVYSLFHYGVPVKAAAGENSETVKLINTDHPELNDFANVDLDLFDEPASYKGRQDEKLRLAMMLDETVKRVRPNGWRGVKPKENIIKGALFDVLQDADEVERLFLVIERQREY